MTISELTGTSKQTIITGNDNVVIVDVFQEVRGGRTLDVSGFTKPVINAGHLVIMETATKEYKPMPLAASGTDYAALPAGHEYAGVVIQSKETKDPRVGILLRGTVNYKAAPYDMTSILDDVKEVLNLIKFVED